MPIKGVSDYKRLDRVGKIRLGIKGKTKSGKSYPMKVDYFVCPDSVKAVYGEKPKRLEIEFFSNDLEIAIPHYLKRYANGQLLCKGDGETALELDQTTKEYKKIKCLGRECPYYVAKKCKYVMNIRFLIPAVTRSGFFQIDTSSFNSIVNLNSTLSVYKELIGRKFRLEVVSETKNVNGENIKLPILHLREIADDGEEQKPTNGGLSINSDEMAAPDDLFIEPPEENEGYPPNEQHGTAKTQNAEGMPKNNPDDIFGAPEDNRETVSGKQPDTGSADTFNVPNDTDDFVTADEKKDLFKIWTSAINEAGFKIPEDKLVDQLHRYAIKKNIKSVEKSMDDITRDDYIKLIQALSKDTKNNFAGLKRRGK